MTMNFNPEAAANKASGTPDPMAQLQALKFETTVPEAWRSLAGTAVNQTREAYEHARTALDAGLQAVERSYDAASQAAAALNRKIIDIAQRNVNSGFDLAKSLASAKNLAEIVELQGAYWRKQFEVLMAQAEEVRELSISSSADVVEPIKQHATKQAEQVRALSKKASAETAKVVERQAAQFQDSLRRAS